MLRETSGQHIHHKKISKPSLFFNSFINQTFLVNIYAENTANLQNRAGRDFFWWCATYIHSDMLLIRIIDFPLQLK